MDRADFVAEYGQAIEERRATILVGAGLSLGAGYPEWGDLLGGFRTELGLDDGITDLTRVAQYVQNELGRDRLISEVCDSIGSVTPIPSENHRLLAQLPIDEVWTTNYDPLIEMGGDGDDVLVELDGELVGADASMRRVYKMHGSIRSGAREPVGGIGNLVLSTDDFDQYERDHPRFWRLLQAQFLTRSFLYLGFSLSDPNFEAMVRLARLTTADRPMTHYALLVRADEPEFDLWSKDLERAGVQVVEIATHSEIPEVLRQLIARTKPSRLFICGSQPTDRSLDCNGLRYPATSELDPKRVEVAAQLGRRLAHEGIRVATGSLLGSVVGYALLEELGDKYDSDRMLLIRRTNTKAVDPPNLRRGEMVFVGDDPSGMRVKLYAQTRAVVVLGGGWGTRTEVDASVAEGMGIVPLACTGGTAEAVWTEMSRGLGAHQLGGRDIDPDTFALLASADPSVAVEAAVKLILQAMYLPESTAT